VKVTSARGTLAAGDVLTCTSDGYPQPTYKWIDSDGVVVSSEPIITLTVSYSKLTCEATGDFATNCSAQKTIQAGRRPHICVLRFAMVVWRQRSPVVKV